MEQIKKIVTDYYNCNFFTIMGYYLAYKDKEHVIDTGTSILSTKWNMGSPRGSFVESVVNNDLMETFSRADDVNIKVIKFYCHLIHNVTKPVDI